MMPSKKTSTLKKDKSSNELTHKNDIRSLFKMVPNNVSGANSKAKYKDENDSEIVIPVTPENENPRKKSMSSSISKVHKINACSRRIQKTSKISLLLQGNKNLRAESKEEERVYKANFVADKNYEIKNGDKTHQLEDKKLKTKETKESVGEKRNIQEVNNIITGNKEIKQPSKLNHKLQTKVNQSDLDIISPIPKVKFSNGTNSKRKLSLKKPIKRHFSYLNSEKVSGFEMKQFCHMKKQTRLSDDVIDSYVGVDIVNKKEKKEIVADLTHIKNRRSIEEEEKYSNDTFGNITEQFGLLDGLTKKQSDNQSSEFDLGDSLLLDDLSCEEESDSANTKFITWLVNDVTIAEYGTNWAREKRLHLRCKENDDVTAMCYLRGDWQRMEVDIGDIVLVSNLDHTKKSCFLDNNSDEFITLFPNTLISGTTIASGITCERQAVLNEQFKGGFKNQAMLVGTITHELFEWMLMNFDSKENCERRLDEIFQTPKYLEMLYELNIQESDIRENVEQYIPIIKHWASSYLNEVKLPDEQEADGFCINKVVDIEENIWSPFYGFKGKIDASVDVTLHRKPRLQKIQMDNVTIPLELKTGTMLSKFGSVEHRAQVAVYCLLMSERYNMPVDSGLLYYIKKNHMQLLPLPSQEKRSLLIKRNEIARRITLEKRQTALPELLRRHRTCKRCPQNHVCMLFHRANEYGCTATSGVNELFEELTSHLISEDLQYFSKWYELCMIETHYEASQNESKYIWRKPSSELERRGTCFSGMVLVHSNETLDKKQHCVFERKKNHFNVCTPLNCIPITCGERVLISVEQHRVFNKTSGYIKDVTELHVVVTLQHHLKIDDNDGEVTYRIDKDETLSSYSISLTNIARLFQVGSACDQKLRKAIIHKKPPEFTDSDIDENYIKSSRLNDVQKGAIKKCLQANDYVLIHGMPGAGKSTTIAVLVQSLVAAGRTVLLSSYTHSAVDTILLKLVQNGFDSFIRLGQLNRVHESIRRFTAVEQTSSFTQMTQFAEYYDSKRVFATTCLGVNHAALSKKQFDYCIVDEASQITQPVCIGVIRLATVFVLVGDHSQLPPLVQSSEAREKGMDVSLFNELSSAHPEAVVTLNVQYRMNESIMSLSNALIYNSEMRCGNPEVSTGYLYLPKYDQKKSRNYEELLRIIDPIHPVVFVDTDESGLKESHIANKLTNRGEAHIVKKIVMSLIECGLDQKDLGIICPYRNQLKMLRDSLESLSVTLRDIEIDTIDKYQGKDKECIIVTFVRSNDKQEVGNLLKDWRRVNVALTRAKKKLILIGSKKTLINSNILNQMIDLIEKNDWLVRLNMDYK